MANALVQVRIDSETKKEASAVLAVAGMTISDAMRIMLRKIAVEKKLPFEPLVPNAETIAAMRELQQGKAKRFQDVASLMADLNADD